MPVIIQVASGLYAPPCTPPFLCSKAVRLLKVFHDGCHNYRVLKDGRGNGYYKINVGRRWRLLSRDRGRSWELMTHERYNTARKK